MNGSCTPRDNRAVRFADSRPTNDFRELLDRDDIDAVIIATGERWHPAISIRAAQAGKDIYCEKPISLTIRQARTMAETVRRHNRVFQTGLQQRNSSEYLKAFEMVHAGRIGEVQAGLRLSQWCEPVSESSGRAASRGAGLGYVAWTVSLASLTTIDITRAARRKTWSPGAATEPSVPVG